MWIIAPLLCGLIFGAGLLISGMVQPTKVLGFLDILGAWDPSLAVVMAAALAVSVPGFMLAKQRSRPWLAKQYFWPSKSEIVVPDTEFRGEDLSQELAQIIGDFAPTMVLVPRKEDQHADHCAAWFFVADALFDVKRLRPDFDVELINYIVHYYSWPFEDDRPRIDPPEGLSGGISGWLTVPLSAAEVRVKREALARYKSQMDVMGWFLNGFARRNELFSRPAASLVTLPVRRSPCDNY